MPVDEGYFACVGDDFDKMYVRAHFFPFELCALKILSKKSHKIKSFPKQEKQLILVCLT
ncbi:hypothetical protein HYC85_029580 [Camellia sinensis]|uniref:Uncharacterized protein n=1 Tax=Camellia sinensis TaxID=4442 RepID=A0A7J7FYI9_CAMSI|nr:hypothetical protein HYC85_029580 [Camellia sinensis]